MTRTKRRSKQPYQIQGVDALLGESEDKTQAESQLPLAKIKLPDTQPRRYFEPKAMKDLVESIKAHGLLQPILVRPLSSQAEDESYELVAGERRYRAAIEAGLSEIAVVIRELTKEEAFHLALLENLQREDLNPVEETEAIISLLSRQLKLTNQEVIDLFSAAAHPERKSVDNVIHSPNWQQLLEVFRVVGKFTPESFRTNRLPLLKLPQDILEVLRQGKIEYTKAKALSSLKEESARKELMAEAIAKSLSLREIKERIKAAKPQPQKEEIFNRWDNVSKQVKKSKKLILENSRQRKKLESLLAQLEKLFEQPS